MRFFLLIIMILTLSNGYSQSGGVLNANQAAYDVTFYGVDLKFNIDYSSRSIEGSVLIQTQILESIDTLELDLWNTLTIDSVLVSKNGGDEVLSNFEHADKKLMVHIQGSSEINDIVSARVFYHGTPHTASNPPWDDGFTWRLYSNGNFKLGVTCEQEGADIWLPCKDHPSDEPDSVALNFTVPDTLDCISNGKLLDISFPTDSTKTYHWFHGSPINNYNITFYISEYDLLEANYWSVIGDSIPMQFWVSINAYGLLENMIPNYRQEFSFLEQTFGPYPFLTEKLGFAHSSYDGMEHQTIIAYGNDFSLNNWGYDYIHYHELAHEWWGNFISAKDWSDVWIHEGLATYSEALYVEYVSGLESYMEFMRSMQPPNLHALPLAPRESVTADFGFYNLDPYYRGASVLHTLRYHLGDNTFKNLLKRWVYPDLTDLDNTNGRQCRILNTDEMMYAAEEITGRSLEPFFEVFFREATYPKLIVTRESDFTSFEWETENSIPLDLNVPITVNGDSMDVEMDNGVGEVEIAFSDTLEIDPEKWILMLQPDILVGITSDVDDEGLYFLSQNYPNPMHNSTTIKFKTPIAQRVNLKIYNSVGQLIKTLIDRNVPAGIHEVELMREQLNSGLYYYTLAVGNYLKSRRLVVE